MFAIAIPLAFALHVAEEAPGFVAWFNGHVSPPITNELFLTVNVTGLAITVLTAALLAAVPEAIPALAMVMWLGFLMLANGIFHLTATIVDGSYCPGVASGTLVYLPLTALFMRAVVKELRLPATVVIGVALVGGIPMFVHGYRIVFLGSRLF